MTNNENKKVYASIKDSRLLKIKVILDDERVVYEGMVEDAPEEIKNLKYSKIKMINPITYYVYSEFN